MPPFPLLDPNPGKSSAGSRRALTFPCFSLVLQEHDVGRKPQWNSIGVLSGVLLNAVSFGPLLQLGFLRGPWLNPHQPYKFTSVTTGVNLVVSECVVGLSVLLVCLSCVIASAFQVFKVFSGSDSNTFVKTGTMCTKRFALPRDPPRQRVG